MLLTGIFPIGALRQSFIKNMLAVCSSAKWIYTYAGEKKKLNEAKVVCHGDEIVILGVK